MTQARPASGFLVVLDADSTLIEEEAIELLAERAGSLAEVSAVTERAMRGELDFRESLTHRVATLAGLPAALLPEIAANIHVTKGVEELIHCVRAAGGAVGVVSGGFHELLDPIAEGLGLDFWSANRLDIVDGTLAGTISGSVVDAHAKAEALKGWSARTGISMSRTVAVGDGANDLQMMDAAALAIAFDAKPAVRERADLAISARDLSQVLPLLGLRG